jgi:hypothetical protein
MEQIILDFENITKYPLLNFLIVYKDFIVDSYSEIERYFSGKTDNIDNKHLKSLNNITIESGKILSIFKSFSGKFENCGYWELMNLIDELNTTIEKINKLPKFRKTSLTKKGYQPVIQISGSVGGFRTMEDVANSVKTVNNDNTEWVDLMLGNDLNEEDWEIDTLSQVNVFVINNIDIVVNTILDQPIGKRIYGIDINRSIDFDDNDLSLKIYEDNIEQKCDILLELNQGDVPENLNFGKNINLYTGSSVKQFLYSELAQDIENTFLQNDLFESVELTDFSFNQGSIQSKCNIKTKYDYKTEKTITI